MSKGWRIAYYSAQDGSKPVQEYIDTLSPEEQAKILSFIGLLKEEGRSDYLCRFSEEDIKGENHVL